MTLSEHFQICQALQQLQNFAECILVDLRNSQFATEWTLQFNYVWDDKGKIRKNLDEEVLIALRFGVVQEFRLSNALTESMRQNMGDLNWGMGEVADVQICDPNSMSDQYQNPRIPFHHVICRWETDRRIDIVFSTLTVVRSH